jgi:EAL domain-containing protein (putative c-di-GMP-specific phosphodiesterase class I)
MQLSEKLSSGEWPSDFKLHVNISLVQLMQQDFAHSLFATLARHNIAPHNISIEITETSMMKETEILMETISTIRRGGVSVAIDDFGSGFSSLSYLHKLEFDTLKIDKDFVSDVLTDSRNESIVSAVIRLSHGFNVPLVAEGVETAEVADKLQAMGCQKAQGYYFARPMPLSEWPDIGKVLP